MNILINKLKEKSPNIPVGFGKINVFDKC